MIRCAAMPIQPLKMEFLLSFSQTRKGSALNLPMFRCSLKERTAEYLQLSMQQYFVLACNLSNFYLIKSSWDHTCWNGWKSRYHFLFKDSSAKLPVKSEHCFPIFCYCRLPVLPSFRMIQCRKCKDWYHNIIDACICSSRNNTGKKAQWKCSCC